MSDKANDITKITDFVADGKPKGKKKGKWSLATDILRNQVAKEAALHQMSRITNRVRKDPKDQRQHRDIRYVSKVTDNNHGRYIYHDWGEEEANDLFLSYNVSTESYVSMHDYEVIDTAPGRTERELGTRNVMVFDNDTGEFLVGKVSQRQCRECMGKKGDQNRMYKDIAKTLKIKPDIGRGNQRSGLSSAYKIYGFRKDPKGTAVSMYAFLPNSDEKDKKEALQIIGRLCEKMEKAASRIGNYLAESKIYKLIQKFAALPSVVQGQLATAMNIGQNYWSKCHVDSDFHYTTLSCLVHPSKGANDVIYYFCNPVYKIAIPMRPGDILLFNPHITHSVCNPRYQGTFIFSAYVSKKTVLSHTSDVFLNH